MTALDDGRGPVRAELDGAVATIVVDHPPLNLFDVDVRDGLIEALNFARDVPDVRAVVVRSGLKHSGAGADLSEFGSASSNLDARRIRWDRDAWSLLWSFPVPVIASLRGLALGSAYEMALLCHLRVAAPDATLGLPEVRLGMLPAAGGTQSLTAAIGPHEAIAPILTAGSIDAEEAHRLGIVHVVADDPDAAALDIARRLATADAAVVGALVRLVRASTDHTLATGIELERTLTRACRPTRTRGTTTTEAPTA